MLFLLFLLIIIAGACASYYFTNKMSAQRKQILLLKYQNNNLKQETKPIENKSITVKYVLPEFKEGIITKRCELFIAPLENSPVINFISENTLVEIQDSAHIDNNLWYEVLLTPKESINSKGWVKEASIKSASVSR